MSFLDDLFGRKVAEPDIEQAYQQARDKMSRLQGHNVVTWPVPAANITRVQMPIDPSQPLTVGINGHPLTQGKDFEVGHEGINFTRKLHQGDIIVVDAFFMSHGPLSIGMNPITNGNTTSSGSAAGHTLGSVTGITHTPRPIIRYREPVNDPFVATLSIDYGDHGRSEQITKEELEYLVTAGRAILKHMEAEGK